MAKQRKRDRPRLDDTMAQGVGNEPQPSNTLPEAVVGQTEHPREGLGQPDEEGDFGSGLDEPDESGLSSGIGKAREGDALGGTIPEPSGQQVGGARNGRGAQRETRESIVDRDRDSADRDSDSMVDRDTEIRRETDFRDATGHPLDEKAGGRKVTREDDIFRREEDA